MALRISNRLFNLVILSITALFLITFLWNFSDSTRSPILNTEEVDLSPDYILRNTHSRQYNENGELNYVMNTDSITHIPMERAAMMKKPAFEVYDQGALTWTMNSDLGKVLRRGKLVEMSQRIVVASDDQRTILKTPQLSILTKKQFVYTDKNVTLLSPNGFTRSVGMTADLKTEQVNLLDQVVGQYDPTIE